MANPRKDYSSEIGKVYGNSKIIGIEWKKQSNRFRPYAIFKCKCGKEGSTVLRNLQIGTTKGCGCEKGSNLQEFKKHGLSNHRLYKIRRGMIQRCYNKNGDNYDRYGGRGIIVCEEWKNSFESFYEWAINNGYQDDLTIERINNDGNYEPSNCKWATMKEQANNKDFTKIIKHCKSMKKPILKIDLYTLDVLEEFNSIKEAKEITGIKNIDACLAKRNSHAGGYYWEYKNKKEKEGIL